MRNMPDLWQRGISRKNQVPQACLHCCTLQQKGIKKQNLKFSFMGKMRLQRLLTDALAS